ncbi:formylglycine-generating enzyme family protein [Magnetospirillum fulvum]|uniref:Formylglycine-generating enzyme, required for sulfatase activity, contains SUMF1/FGE domain n=1 Tax=Magnetospirillum fulvum TaxID=1082 RepID=A0A1H6H029_MAGFU|nr:formylglycine-generating enzyme family protein [Magnetospirillum fulvum]SEH28522.1 Formylglycine-generating enzyme, required for sulfatase activity, contains SUMF1/FGE domain [Magnetospirillum fulvum]
MRLRTVAIALLLAGGLAASTPARAEPAAGTLWTDPATGIAFVWVPGGTFEMGCGAGPGCPEAESPAHSRRVGGFWLSRTEITQGQWSRLMETNPSKFRKGDDYPVDQVTWEDAHALIAKMNTRGSGTFRLPSEAEWEYACRAGNPTDPYCGGTAPDAVAWFNANSKMATMPVATKAANRFGLFDMSGNLYEWVEDCWHDSHAGAPADASARTGGECLSRVLRGGSWGNYPTLVRVTTRRSDSDVKCPFIGLRLVRER